MENEAAVQVEQQVEQQIPRSEPRRDDSAPARVAEQSALLPLDLAERSVCWRNREGQVRTHTFRRLTERDWDGYFLRIKFENDRKSELLDWNSAKVWLYGQCVTRVAGYQVRGGGNLCDLPNWRDKIPFGQRLDAIDLLTTAYRNDGEQEMEPDCEVVALDAFWDAADGKMVQYTGLVHRFKSPAAEDLIRYSRETNRSEIVPGPAGKTIRMVRQRVLLKLYDELIVSVDGYGVGAAQGSELKPLSSREEIVREMDAGHKAVAVSQLFSVLGEQCGNDSDSD